MNDGFSSSSSSKFRDKRFGIGTCIKNNNSTIFFGTTHTHTHTHTHSHTNICTLVGVMGLTSDKCVGMRTRLILGIYSWTISPLDVESQKRN